MVTAEVLKEAEYSDITQICQKNVERDISKIKKNRLNLM